MAVGAVPEEVDVGLGGGEVGFSPEGMRSSCPMLIMSLVSPLRSLIACAVVSNRAAMLLRVSPDWTT